MITDRDFKVLEYLFWVGVCDGLNIAKLFFMYKDYKYNKQHVRIANRRLQGMRGQGLIKPFPNTEGGSMLYSLTNQGILYVGQKLNISTVNVKEKKGYLSYSVTKHAQAIAEVYYWLQEGERQWQYKIKNIRFERANREEFLAGNETIIIQPDIYLDIGKKYYLEVDNGTERLPEIKEKLARYEKWYKRRAGAELIFVCNSEKRAAQLRGIKTRMRFHCTTKDVRKLTSN